MTLGRLLDRAGGAEPGQPDDTIIRIVHHKADGGEDVNQTTLTALRDGKVNIQLAPNDQVMVINAKKQP